jgi:hypothetical protein
MRMPDLNSSHFSDENGHIICTIWICNLRDMNYAIFTHFKSDFKYVQILLSKTQKKVHIWKEHEKLIKMDIKFVKFGFQKVPI